MLFSNLVMWSIIIATGQTLGANGHRTIQSAAEAASALRPIAGSLATTLFAIGFIGSGMLAVPVLAGSGAAAMSGLLGKRWGFSRSVKGAPVFYGLVALGTATGTLLSVLGFDPIRLLVLVATINGVAAAPFLAIVMLVSGDRTIMGASRNGRLATVVGWLTVAVMAGAALAFLVTSTG